MIKLPPGHAAANAPSDNYFDTQIYFDPSSSGARAAASALDALVAPAQLRPLPLSPSLRSLDPHSMLLVVVGETFHNQLDPQPRVAAAPATPAFSHTAPSVVYQPSATAPLLQALAPRAGFRLELPTVLAAESVPDTLPGDVPDRLYTLVPGHKAVVLVYHTPDNDFWDIEETDWGGAPILRGHELPARARRPQLPVLLRGLGPAHDRAFTRVQPATGSSTAS